MNNAADEYYTPAYAVKPILNRLRANSRVWCPFDTENSNYVKVLRENGFEVKYGHISTGQDFFLEEVPDCDYIISNPPYSKKTEVFMRLFEIGIPFAMLVNMQGIFDSKDRFEMFRNNKFEVMWLSPRVDFIRPDSTTAKGVPFQSGYLCSGILEHQTEFETIEKTR